MRLFHIADVKGFMNTLLKGSVFDDYETRGVSLQTFTTFDISCACVNIDGERKTKYCTWSEIKPVVYDLIKGKKAPQSIKIGLCLSGDAAECAIPNAAALHITITYEKGAISVLTGSSQKSFALDNSVDGEWDKRTAELFRKSGFEPLENAE